MEHYTIIRGPRVQAETGLSRSTILRRIHAGVFPRPIALGRRSVGWRAMEIDAVNAAVIRGASEGELRELVRRLETSRQLVKAPAGDLDVSSHMRGATAVNHD